MFNGSIALWNFICQLNFFSAFTELIRLSLGDVAFIGGILGFMFIVAIKFQNISLSAVLGLVAYAIFFSVMPSQARLFVGVALSLFIGYALYSMYTREDV